MQSALDDDTRLEAPMRAVVRVARALGVADAVLADEDRAELLRHYNAAAAEWIVLGIAMMGWLNKTMDGLGVPLEPSAVAEVNDVMIPSGWSPGKSFKDPPGSSPPPRADSLWTKLRVVRYAPSAMSLDKQWTANVPDTGPAAMSYLKQKTGHDFPVLGRLQHGRAIRAIATAIRDNFAEAGSVIGLPHKLAAGLVYAERVGAHGLAANLRALGAGPITDPRIAGLAQGLAPSPTTLDAAAVEACRALPAGALVELVTFISLLQLLHRLDGFYKT